VHGKTLANEAALWLHKDVTAQGNRSLHVRKK
jgi:hypothetical protein